MSDADKVAELEERCAKLSLQVSMVARSIPGLLLYATTYPNDSHVRDAIAVLEALARNGDDPNYYAKLLKRAREIIP